MSILTHILAAMGGGFAGVALMALCFAASKADEAIYSDEKRHSGLLEDDE